MKKYLFIILALFFLGCGDSSNEAQTVIEDRGDFNSLKAEASKDYELITTEGEKIKFTYENEFMTHKTIQGKYVLINFWATWCEPCKIEIPILNKIYSENKNRLEIVGVLFNDTISPNGLEKYMSKYKMSYPITTSATNNRLGKNMDNVQMVPESFLFGPDGKFIKKFVGEIKKKDFLKYLN